MDISENGCRINPNSGQVAFTNFLSNTLFNKYGFQWTPYLLNRVFDDCSFPPVKIYFATADLSNTKCAIRKMCYSGFYVNENKKFIKIEL